MSSSTEEKAAICNFAVTLSSFKLSDKSHKFMSDSNFSRCAAETISSSSSYLHFGREICQEKTWLLYIWNARP